VPVNTEIRKATKADLHVLLPLISSYHKWEGIKLTKQVRQETVAVLLDDSSPGHVWLIEESDKIIGYIILCVSFLVPTLLRGNAYTVKKKHKSPGAIIL